MFQKEPCLVSTELIHVHFTHRLWIYLDDLYINIYIYIVMVNIYIYISVHSAFPIISFFFNNSSSLCFVWGFVFFGATICQEDLQQEESEGSEDHSSLAEA